MNSLEVIKTTKYKRRKDSSWDYRKTNTKEYTHCYHAYPAMMIPPIARRLLTDYRPNGKLDLVFDPYMGSGTTLVECLIMNITSIGTDINPLARMIAEAKTTLLHPKVVFQYLQSIIYEFKNFSVKNYPKTDFSRITKSEFWYNKETLCQLDYISILIQKIVEPKVQIFFNLCLAEIVRECSFTRNGEFKRYKMSATQLQKFIAQPFELFKTKANRNLKGLYEITRIKNTGQVTIDAFNTVYSIPDYVKDESIDMIVTSPPYGDSRTTVAYGQFSRWANEWFGFENAKQMDRLLMGGTRLKANEVNLQTSCLYETLEEIKQLDVKRYLEVVSFLKDYKQSIHHIAPKVRSGGRVCYVVGNRRVKGVQIPLDFFTAEQFEANGFVCDEIIVRSIPNKRMPSKNSPTNEKGKKNSTMNAEFIVVLTKE